MEIDESKIIAKMHELEKVIDHHFNDIHKLSNAMDRREVESPYKRKVYFNDYYALVGDAIIKIALSEYLYSNGKKTSSEITIIKKNIEDNETFHKITEEEKLFHFAFNDQYFYLESPEHYKVSYNNHDSFIEAIVAAIYYDSGIECAKKWVNEWLIKRHNIKLG